MYGYFLNLQIFEGIFLSKISYVSLGGRKNRFGGKIQTTY